MLCVQVGYQHIFLGGGPRVVVSTAAFHARVRGSVPGLGGLKETKLFLPHPRVKVSIVGSLRDREVACSASDRQGPNFGSCVWRTVSSQSSHHPQEVLLAQFSLYVHKGGLKPDSFHFYQHIWILEVQTQWWSTVDIFLCLPLSPMLAQHLIGQRLIWAWGNPADTARWKNDVLMFGQCLRRWANIKTTLFKLIVFAGNWQYFI